MIPYKKRSIRFLELTDINGWRVKTYGISVNNEYPNSALIREAKVLAGEKLPTPPKGSSTIQNGLISLDRYGIAVLIIHEGKEGGFVLIDWWVGENMLQHHVYFSPKTTNCEFEYLSPSGIMSCVWELRVLSFEREAWIEYVLENKEGANLDKYCSSHFSGDV